MKWTLFLLLWLPFSASYCEYLALTSSNLKQQHNFIGENITLEQLAYGAELNLQSLRYERTGWFARGPKLQYTSSQDSLTFNGQMNIYQSHLHQGFWLEINWQDSQFRTEINQDLIYLNESGTAISLLSGDTINSKRASRFTQLYWFESLKDEGPINTAGLFYSTESNPTASSITSTNADVFDGNFNGFGFTIGRIKDDRGLNFQWRMNAAQYDTNFSDDVTNHRALSSQESKVYKLGIELNWHYRYYLGPYWYLVPSTHLQYHNIMQTQLNPEFVEHENLSYLEFAFGIALRRYF